MRHGLFFWKTTPVPVFTRWQVQMRFRLVFVLHFAGGYTLPVIRLVGSPRSRKTVNGSEGQAAEGGPHARCRPLEVRPHQPVPRRRPRLRHVLRAARRPAWLDRRELLGRRILESNVVRCRRFRRDALADRSRHPAERARAPGTGAAERVGGRHRPHDSSHRCRKLAVTGRLAPSPRDVRTAEIRLTIDN